MKSRSLIAMSDCNSNTASQGFGGMIYASYAGFVQVNFTNIIRNEAVQGGAAFLSSTIFQINGAHNQKAHVTRNVADFGGAIMAAEGGHLILSYANVLENSAHFDGGALCTRDQAKLDVGNSRLVQNIARARGGAIYLDRLGTAKLNKAEVSRNMAEADGGGLYLGFGTGGSATDTKFEGNKAHDNGGAIFVSDAPFVVRVSRPTIGHNYLCRFNFNSVKSGRGGAILVERKGSITVEGCQFKSNGLQQGTEGGAIAAINTANVKIVKSSFDNNLAASNGGAIFSMHDSKIIVEHSQFSQNSAGQLSSRRGRGGAIYLVGSTIAAISSSEFNENQGGEVGGGIYAGENSKMTLSRTQLSRNKAGSAGGGVYISHLKCVIQTSGESNNMYYSWVPDCLYDEASCKNEEKASFSTELCIVSEDLIMRDNEARLGGALFWEYKYNGTGGDALKCERCDVGKNVRTGKNDIATDAVSVKLGWFPHMANIESE